VKTPLPWGPIFPQPHPTFNYARNDSELYSRHVSDNRFTVNATGVLRSSSYVTQEYSQNIDVTGRVETSRQNKYDTTTSHTFVGLDSISFEVETGFSGIRLRDRTGRGSKADDKIILSSLGSRYLAGFLVSG
jgi:hypothetical protein